jgi:hypothetical protein
VVSVQVEHTLYRAVLLMIGRSWVRAPPASLHRRPVQPLLTCDDAVSEDAFPRFGYAVVCDRKRRYAARRGKYAAKQPGVICACCYVVCLGMTLRNASPTLIWVARHHGYGGIRRSALLNLAVLRSRRRLRRR